MRTLALPKINLEPGINFLLVAIAAMLIIYFLSGCVSLGPSAEQLKALSESKRSWCLTQSNVYVPYLMVGGTGIEGGAMECSKDGMKVNDRGVEVLTEKETVKSKTVAPKK